MIQREAGVEEVGVRPGDLLSGMGEVPPSRVTFMQCAGAAPRGRSSKSLRSCREEIVMSGRGVCRGAEGVTAIERPSWSANQIVAHGSEVRVPDPREVL